MDQARERLAVTKRAQTAADLLRGIEGADRLGRVLPDFDQAARDQDLRSLLDAGLRKIWHYHMGFVAVELSVCGAAPPFGPLRAGKLMASLAGSAEALEHWGSDRPLGDIAATVYDASVRLAVPNPGPLVLFTAGLYPGHSAQYTRASSGAARWLKIGETTGFGSFHISNETMDAVHAYNRGIDGYRHVSHEFGEGASPRFRAVGRALDRLGLPDLRQHKTHRPIYALPLVREPLATLAGWTDTSPGPRPGIDALAQAWWSRWVAPRVEPLAEASSRSPDLRDELAALIRHAELAAR
jgi:hypothetical protein